MNDSAWLTPPEEWIVAWLTPPEEEINPHAKPDARQLLYLSYTQRFREPKLGKLWLEINCLKGL